MIVKFLESAMDTTEPHRKDASEPLAGKFPNILFHAWELLLFFFIFPDFFSNKIYLFTTDVCFLFCFVEFNFN